MGAHVGSQDKSDGTNDDKQKRGNLQIQFTQTYNRVRYIFFQIICLEFVHGIFLLQFIC